LLTFRDFITAFRKLDIERTRPVIVHASLAAFGEVHGGVDTILGALSSSFHTFIMPAFTYQTMLIPELGPPDNALTYGSGRDTNKMAEFFRSSLPADPMMGSLAETVRIHPNAARSTHPILSFTGMNAKPILDAQTIQEPLLPIQALTQDEGWVLLLGVDQTVNTSIHYGELLAGRKQFVRWALTPKGVVTCPGFPGCSDGFEALSLHLTDSVRKVEVGETVIQAIPLEKLVESVPAMIKGAPSALLCEREDCERCNAVRASVVSQNVSSKAL
jgi:aminoglycoside 3-N-acetyltransferase